MTLRRRIFGLEEANALLPELEALLVELEAKQESFDRKHEEIFFEELLNQGDPAESSVRELEENLQTLAHQVEKIQHLGCVLRNLRMGVVDFLAREGKELFFYCWRRGEKRVGFCHSLGDGFLERKPIFSN